MTPRLIGLVTAGGLAVIGFVFGGLAAINQWHWHTYVWAIVAILAALCIAAVCSDQKPEETKK